MFSILLSIPKCSRHSNVAEVSWESVHSHFSDLFSEDFICVIKPYNDDHTLAKVFFKKKVTFGAKSDKFLINNAVPATIVERKEEPTLLPMPTASGTVDLAGHFGAEQLLEIRVNLEDRYRVEVKTPAAMSGGGATNTTSVTLHACHPEVLESAQAELRKWASATTVAAAAAAASSTSSSSCSSTVPKPSSQRRRLFPAAFSADGIQQAAALAPSSQQPTQSLQPQTPLSSAAADLGGPYDFELALNDRCVLRVQPLDITALQCDLLVVTTSCALSLNFGLARVVAAKAGRQSVKQYCSQRIAEGGGNLKFGELHGPLATPANSQLPARHLLFLALPNDSRLTEQVDAVQFKAVMGDVVSSLLDRLASLSGPPTNIRSVAMTPLGVCLPYWADLSEDFAHVLAACLWDRSVEAAGARTTGELRCLNVCDLQLEHLATLGRVLAARFGPEKKLTTLNSTQSIVAAGREFAPPATASGSVHDDEDADACCDICCEPLSPANPAVAFHCGRGRLCGSCVRRLHDPSSPGLGKCPTCLARYRPAIGSQPAGGTMTVNSEAISLPGHESHATLVVTYTFGPGIQGREHASPGQPYRGASRVTYFPDSPDGRAIVRRLRVAFDGRAVFTVGTSATTGMDNTVTWATVHHKTNTSGGPTKHGYPDPTYLQRVSDELEALGY